MKERVREYATLKENYETFKYSEALRTHKRTSLKNSTIFNSSRENNISHIVLQKANGLNDVQPVNDRVASLLTRKITINSSKANIIL